MNEIAKLLKRGESETVEFKPSLSQMDKIMASVSAFSNTKGGEVVIGVSDKSEVLGVDIGERTIENLANRIKQNTDPAIYPSISIENVEGKNIIVIEVKESKSKPVFAFDKVYKRVGKSNQRVSSGEIRKLALEGKKIYWDEEICEEASLEDIDEEKVEWYMEKRGIKKPTDMGYRQFLSSIKAVKEVNVEIKPANAGVLFFGKNPQRFFLRARIHCVRFDGNEISRNTVDESMCEGTVWQMLEDAENFVNKRTCG